MKYNKNSYGKLTFFFFLFFTLYEIIASRSEDESIPFEGILQITPYMLFCVLLYGFIISSRKIEKNVGMPLLVMTISSYLIMLLWFLFYPLASNLILITLSFPFLSFHLMRQKGKKDTSDKIILYCISISFLILSLIYAQNYTVDILKSSTNGGKAYSVVFFLPFIFCLQKRLLRYLLMVILLLVAFFSMKRGCIVASVVFLLTYLLSLNISIGKHKIIKIIALALVLGVVAYYVYSYADEYLDNRLTERFDDTTGSGRDEIYYEVYSMFFKSPVIEKILGHGWYGVSRESSFHMSAHNDYLEILYDLGLLFFVIYLFFIWRLLICSIKLFKIKSEYAPTMIASVIMLVTTSIFTHVFYYPYYFILFTSFWGYISGKIEQSRIKS